MKKGTRRQSDEKLDKERIKSHKLISWRWQISKFGRNVQSGIGDPKSPRWDLIVKTLTWIFVWKGNCTNEWIKIAAANEKRKERRRSATRSGEVRPWALTPWPPFDGERFDLSPISFFWRLLFRGNFFKIFQNWIELTLNFFQKKKSNWIKLWITEEINVLLERASFVRKHLNIQITPPPSPPVE